MYVKSTGPRHIDDSAPATSIAALLEAATRILADSSDSPRLDAEVLLARALGRPRSYLHAWPEEAPSPAQAQAFAHCLGRRAEGMPIAYLTGVREFFSLPIEVSPAVLIPRPETELLVELALERIRADAGLCLLDAGTGSGAIAIAIALASAHARRRIVASDISCAALAVAKRNAARLGARDLAFTAADWLAPFAPLSFDIIVSNPPYVPDADPHLEQGDVRAEPRVALASGKDGLDAIRAIARDARRCLRGGGWLILEHGHDQREAVADILTRGGFRRLQAMRDLSGRERATCGQR